MREIILKALKKAGKHKLEFQNGVMEFKIERTFKDQELEKDTFMLDVYIKAAMVKFTTFDDGEFSDFKILQENLMSSKQVSIKGLKSLFCVLESIDTELRALHLAKISKKLEIIKSL